MIQNSKIKSVSRNGWRLVWVLALGAVLVSSCALRRLKRNVEQINERGVIEVKTISPAGPAQTYAFAWPSTARLTNEMIGFQPVGTDGRAVFLLLQNRSYHVAAFSDLDGNGTYDGGEPVALARDIRPTPLADTAAHVVPLELRLSPTNGLPAGYHLTLPRTNADLGEALSVKLGEIANLDDPKFSAEVGEFGMWQPLDYLRQYGLAVYFLEPYDPHKIPVMFVYGISGSFQDWRPIMEKLDRTKYQPWLYYYPGGIRSDKAANGLAAGMLLLQQKYHFERMGVVAHSMGGLVARGAIQRAASQAKTNFISEFISISTPWGGHEAAAMGVKHLDFPVPAWRDMAPGSDYLRDILARPLPAGTRYHLIFGYHNSGGMGLPDDNDGVVGIESELVLQVQDEAATVFGMHLDHAQILLAPEVVQKIEKALAR